MLVTAVSSGATCRRAIMPACDPFDAASAIAQQAGAAPSTVDGGQLFVRKGDILDFGIDWSAWLMASNAILASSTFAANASSPKAPTLTQIGIDTIAGQSSVLVDASAAVVGDVYWLDNTVTVTPASPPAAGAAVMPTRQIKRMIAIRVVA